MLRGFLDVTPNYLAGQGSEGKSSISLATKRADEVKPGGMTFTVKLKAKDADAAASFIAIYEELMVRKWRYRADGEEEEARVYAKEDRRAFTHLTRGIKLYTENLQNHDFVIFPFH